MLGTRAMSKLIVAFFLTSSLATVSFGQTGKLNRAQLKQIAYQQSEVYSVLDRVETQLLDLEAYEYHERRYKGQRYKVGFRGDDIHFVQFHPSWRKGSPNWHQALCLILGDNPAQQNWRVDRNLTALFPSVTLANVSLQREAKRVKSREITFDVNSGKILNVSPLENGFAPIGRLYWHYSGSHEFRYVFRHRKSGAVLMLVGSVSKSTKIVPGAVNTQLPFIHRPTNIHTVMVASPDVFYRYLIHACSNQMSEHGWMTYEQKLATFIPFPLRELARRQRLGHAIRQALFRRDVAIESIAHSIRPLDREWVLQAVTARSRDKTRTRKLQLLGLIGGKSELTYCAQFVDRPLEKEFALDAMKSIAKRLSIELPKENLNDEATWKEWSAQLMNG